MYMYSWILKSETRIDVYVVFVFTVIVFLKDFFIFVANCSRCVLLVGLLGFTSSTVFSGSDCWCISLVIAYILYFLWCSSSEYDVVLSFAVSVSFLVTGLE